MSDGDIDYAKYTLLELEEALAGINRHQYPGNYANLCSAYRLLTNTLPSTTQAEQIDDICEDKEGWAGPKFDESGRYIPNQITQRERISHILLSLLLFAYGSYGVWVNDLYIPGKRSRGVHLHDAPAWIMYGAAVCACMVMLSVVVDHYDRRNNERHYRTFAAIGGVLGWTFFGISLLWVLFNGA